MRVNLFSGITILIYKSRGGVEDNKESHYYRCTERSPAASAGFNSGRRQHRGKLFARWQARDGDTLIWWYAPKDGCAAPFTRGRWRATGQCAVCDFIEQQRTILEDLLDALKVVLKSAVLWWKRLVRWIKVTYNLAESISR